MRVLVACEESQAVTHEFRKLGHEAWSCDILPASGPIPEFHLQQDVLPLLREAWDLIVAFPPCTHLSYAGIRWFPQKIADGRQASGIDFFMQFTNIDCPRVAIENPMGIMSKVWRKHDQIIQPWQFGDEYNKRTCLWLKGLPKLQPTNIVSRGEMIRTPNGKTMSKWYAECYGLPPEERSRRRSRTFPGIAKAIAQQWSIN